MSQSGNRQAGRPNVFGELFAPVDASSIAVFRMAFGTLMLWEMVRYFGNGWIGRYFVEPQFYFTYYGFGWVRPLPGIGMYLLFAGLAVLASGILLGLFYRISAFLFTVGYSYVFLIDQAQYQNHFYLICLLGLLLTLIPASGCWSLDAWRKPATRSSQIARWTLWLLRTQIGIVYSYAGIAKLNEDWLRGEPMRIWLSDMGDTWLVGSWLITDQAAYFFSYGGLVLDLGIVPLLLWRRTRAFAICVAVAFHLANAWLFTIGVFPWLMIAATTLFLPADWPRRLMQRRFGFTGNRPASAGQMPGPGQQRYTLVFLTFYLSFQLLVPFRHHLYPGNPSWTEEGHRFAWHMKLRDKRSRVHFFVHRPATGEVHEFPTATILTSWQYQMMSWRPDMILQFCHFLADKERQRNQGKLAVHVEAVASLNGRKRQLLIDPSVDLAARPRSLLPADWIVPLVPLDTTSHPVVPYWQE